MHYQMDFLIINFHKPCSLLNVKKKKIQFFEHAGIFQGSKRFAWSQFSLQFDCVHMWLFSDSVSGCQNPASALPLLSMKEGFSPKCCGQINQINKH